MIYIITDREKKISLNVVEKPTEQNKAYSTIRQRLIGCQRAYKHTIGIFESCALTSLPQTVWPLERQVPRKDFFFKSKNRQNFKDSLLLSMWWNQ